MAEFKYGDLVIVCGKCGETQVVEELVTVGRAFYVFNKDDSCLHIECPECNNWMEMRIKPSQNIDEELQVVKEDEKLQEESTSEEVV